MTSGSTTAGPTDLALADVQWLGRLARRLAVDADDADDLAQEALVAAWSQPAREGAQRPWLVAVLRNRLRMLARTRVRREAREGATEAPTAAAQPDAELERIELLRVLLTELEALGPEDRMIVVRRFLDGEDATEPCRRPPSVRGSIARCSACAPGSISASVTVARGAPHWDSCRRSAAGKRRATRETRR
jgi:RNA polymerase sigma factor (sigma-70 family)